MAFDEYFRREIIDKGGMLSSDIFPLEDEVSKLDFYLTTMEELIDKEKQNEIIQLEQGTENLNSDQKSSYWSMYYPVHWDEIFASNLRSSFLITLVSFLESNLNLACKSVEIVVQTSLKSSDLKGSVFERSRKFLECFGNYKKPSKELWEQINNIYGVRNTFVHNNGTIDDSHKGAIKLRKFIKENLDLSESNDCIELEVGFCYFVLETIKDFLLALRDEERELCNNYKNL